MAYSTNPHLPRARATAMRLLVEDQLPLLIVARKCGVHRSTVWRWKRKWDVLNKHVQLTNDNRPRRIAKKGDVGGTREISTFRLAACTWHIPTGSSRPRVSPHAVKEHIVQRVLALRAQLKRCAEVVWHYLTHREGVHISLSSVRRILRRHHCFDGARKPRVRRDNPRRPRVERPGELVEIDTIHHVDPYTGRRLYFYTVIDLYTRMTYVILAPRLSPGLAAQAVLEAQDRWGFTISMVQSDNGPEFSRYFEQTLARNRIATRHTRLGRPNDNAHIERFNRTIQTECIGYYWPQERSAPPPARYASRVSRLLQP